MYAKCPNETKRSGSNTGPVLRAIVLTIAVLLASGCSYIQMQPSNGQAPRIAPPAPSLP